MKEITTKQQVPETWKELCKIAKQIGYHETVYSDSELRTLIKIRNKGLYFSNEGKFSSYLEYLDIGWVLVKENLSIAQMFAIMQALEN